MRLKIMQLQRNFFNDVKSRPFPRWLVSEPPFSFSCWGSIDPNVAKAGAIQSQGAKGAAVVFYCKPLATPDLDCSGFPVRVKTCENYCFSRISPSVHSRMPGGHHEFSMLTDSNNNFHMFLCNDRVDAGLYFGSERFYN
jgi:hypothetical protein